MKLPHLFAIAVIICATEAVAGTWQQITPVPQRLMGLHAETIYDKIYLFGGQVVGGGTGEPTDRGEEAPDRDSAALDLPAHDRRDLVVEGGRFARVEGRGDPVDVGLCHWKPCLE